MVDIHSKSDTSGDVQNKSAIRSRHEHLFARRLADEDLEAAFALTQPFMRVASQTVVRDVLRHNPDSIWGIFRSEDESRDGAMLAGYCSFLLLNEQGAASLLARTLDASEPSCALLSKAGEEPRIVYIWALVAKGLGAAAIPLITEAMGTPYIGKPLYATAGTESGLKILTGFGYQPVFAEAAGIGALYRQSKLSEEKPGQRRSHRMTSRFKTVVVSTPNEMEMVRVIRALFVIEQNCPYDEEFDGNDFSGTHLLGYVDGEPAATMRLRYFSDFVKMERLAVLPRFRRTLIAREIVNASLNLCRRKGYTKVYGHAQKRLVNFWSHLGFKPIDKNYRLAFSDHEYVEMWGELEPHSDPITMFSDPNLFLRPEGRWDEPGTLEKSARRPATSPH